MLKNKIAVHAFIVALLFIFSFMPGCKKSAPDKVTMDFIVGTVMVNATNAAVGNAVKADDTVKTGPVSLAVLRLGESANITIYKKTTVLFKEVDPSGRERW